MRHGLLLLTTAVVSLAVAAAATATPPVHEVGTQPDLTITDQCAFPVLGHIEGNERVTTFFDTEGNPAKRITVFPGNTVTLTNLDTGKSVTLVSTGPSLAKVEPDGSGFFQSMGHGVSITNPVTSEPGIWYQPSGRFLLRFDSDGNVTSVQTTGNFVNLCDELAS